MEKKKFAGQYIWNTHGDWMATLVNGFLWDLRSVWIGWVETNGDVYTTDGEWVGQVSRDSRILRKRTEQRRDLVQTIPPKPARPELPARAPLPPAFAELSFSIIDVLEEDPDVFKRISDLRPDMS